MSATRDGIVQFAGQRRNTCVTIPLGPAFAVLMVLGFVGLQRRGEPWASILLPLAVFALSVSIATWVRWLARPRRFAVATEDVGGEPATVVPVMRGSLAYLAVTMSPLFAVMVWGLVIALRTGGPWWPWVAGAAVVGSFLPQTYRSIARRPVVALTATGVRYRGQTIDACLAWEDVAGVGLRSNLRGAVTTVVGRGSSASWRYTRRFWVFPLEWKPDGEHIDVEVLGRGDRELAAVLTPWVTEYWRSPALRRELGTTDAVRRADDVRARALTTSG